MFSDKFADKDDIKALYSLLLSLKNEKDCEDLLNDLCTAKEIEQMAQRVRAAKLLLSGKTYSQVMEKCVISSATLSRVSRAVQYGKGYKKLIK